MDMEKMQDNTRLIRDEVEIWRGKYEALKKFAISKKIPIPLELESC